MAITNINNKAIYLVPSYNFMLDVDNKSHCKPKWQVMNEHHLAKTM
jgi:hypothetical protein